MKARDRMRLGTIRISGSILAWSAVFVLSSATIAQESPRSLERSVVVSCQLPWTCSNGPSWFFSRATSAAMSPETPWEPFHFKLLESDVTMYLVALFSLRATGWVSPASAKLAANES